MFLPHLISHLAEVSAVEDIWAEHLKLFTLMIEPFIISASTVRLWDEWQRDTLNVSSSFLVPLSLITSSAIVGLALQC